MKKKHPKYIIKQGDTLQSISELFGTEKDIWKRYHNTMCRVDDIIRDRLPSGLEKIYLLPELWEKEVSLNSTFTSSKILLGKAAEAGRNIIGAQNSVTDWAVYPHGANLNHAYWFRYIMEDEHSSTEVRYKILVRHLRQESDETDLYLIHHISDTYVNNQLPSLCMDELAYEVGKVFFPLVVELDREMQWVSLRNYKQIRDKWFSVVRPSLKLRFGGDIGLKYIAKMDMVINQQEKIEAIFKNEIFFRLYFGTIYHSYSQQFETERALEFNTGGSSPVQFIAKCRLHRNLTSKGYKEITQTGTNRISDTPAAHDNYPEDQHANYSSRVLIDAHTNIVREAKFEWTLEDNHQKTTLILYPSRQQCKDEFDIKLDKLKLDKLKSNQGLFSRLFG